MVVITNRSGWLLELLTELIRIDAGWLHCIADDLNEDVEGNMKEAGVDEAVGKVAPQLKNL